MQAHFVIRHLTRSSNCKLCLRGIIHDQKNLEKNNKYSTFFVTKERKSPSHFVRPSQKGRNKKCPNVKSSNEKVRLEKRAFLLKVRFPESLDVKSSRVKSFNSRSPVTKKIIKGLKVGLTRVPIKIKLSKKSSTKHLT